MRWPNDWLIAQGLGEQVCGLMTTRAGGISVAPYDSMNLRLQNDDPQAVSVNQARFAAALGVPPVYLNQVHGTTVVRLTTADAQVGAPERTADASFTTERGLACTVLVADCLPVLLAAPSGLGVAAVHAGWRGLSAGVIEACAQALCEAVGCEPCELRAWLGASIGPSQFEVGADVLQAFGSAASACFVRCEPSGKPDKWLADLPALARLRLARLGVQQVAGGQWCTASNTSQFFSFRRERITGRMAAAIWRL